MKLVELLAWQWQGYARYHRSRANLLLHVVVVPIFLSGNVGLFVALIQGRWLLAGLAAVTMAMSIALQGLGHGRERVPPEPFAGARDALSRLVCEQWITFPRFVLSGAWLRAWRAAVSHQP